MSLYGLTRLQCSGIKSIVDPALCPYDHIFLAYNKFIGGKDHSSYGPPIYAAYIKISGAHGLRLRFNLHSLLRNNNIGLFILKYSFG